MTHEPLFCLQFYSLGHCYLVPNQCVASIQPFSLLTVSSKTFILDTYEWNGKKLPIIDLSLSSEEGTFKGAEFGYLIILKCVHQNNPFYVAAFSAQIPRTLEVKPNSLSFMGSTEGYRLPVSGPFLEAEIVDLTQLGAEVEKKGLKVTETGLQSR